MKKTSYTVFVTFLLNGEPQEIEDITGEAAEAIIAQANAEHDLHFTHEGNEVIIPWGAVSGIYYDKTIEDTEAPYDAICGGCEHPGMYFAFKKYDSVCVTAISGEDPVGTITFTVDGVEHTYNEFSSTEDAYPLDEVADIIEATQDCEPIEGKKVRFYFNEGDWAGIDEADSVKLSAFLTDDDEVIHEDTEIFIENVPKCQ